MYVRTKKGEIFDCYESEQMHKLIYYSKKSKTNGYIDYEDVYKKSDNLIDILQVGDYVNGCSVLHKENNELVCGLLLRYKEENIQNVVTKEAFESIEYKVNK